MAQNNETQVLDSSNELLSTARNLVNQGKELLFSNPLSAAGAFADSAEEFLSLYQTKISNASFQASLGQVGVLNLSVSLGSLGSAISDYNNRGQTTIKC
jgi:hypothetical protein